MAALMDVDRATNVRDDRALERIFRDHHAAAYAAAYRVVGNPMDAEDALQTVFLRLAGGERNLPSGPTADAYVRRAAINAALDIVRARGRHSARPLDETARAGVGTGAPEDGAESADLRRRLRQSLARVSPRAAEAFALRYFEDFGNREIADLLGMTPSAVGVVLHRTRNRLRRELGDPREG